MSETLKPDTFHDDFYDCESTVNTGEDTRERLNAFRARFGAGPTSMTDEQIEEMSEHYRPKMEADMVIIDELSDGQDSREKLEADVWAGCDHLTMAERGDVLVNVPTGRLLGWLDRQAAITKAEQREWWGDVVAELTAERDELREKVRHQSRQLTDTQNALEKRNEEIKPRWKRDTKKLQSRIDALTAERDEWKAKAAEEAANADGHWRNANNIAQERDELRRQVSELRELNDSLHARIEEAKEALS